MARETIPKEKVRPVKQAIRQLMEQREKLSTSSNDGDDFQMRLSNLLSVQLEELKRDGKIRQPELPSDAKELNTLEVAEAKSETGTGVVGGGTINDSGREEIIKELRKVKRQNFITHCLLSTMIVLTAAWQLSEVSLVLKIKEGFNHPFKSLGGMLAGMLKRPAKNGENQASSELEQIEGPPLPPLKIPELPHLDLPLGSESEQG
ncbi:hypothetical protein NMG60_11030925 [Bertholletia excelsa]